MKTNADDLRLPPQTKFIIGNEACERFSYYGMVAILTLYMVRVLGMSEAEATGVMHNFKAAVYFLPLAGAWLADRWLGRYWTILSLSFFYCLGHGVLAVSEGSAGGLYLGLALIAVGAGGIKPCVSAFVGDQLASVQERALLKAYSLFYWSINFGSFFAFGLIPTIRENYGYSWAFGIPGIAMGIATFIFWVGTRHYVRVPPRRGAEAAGFVRVFLHALARRGARRSGQSFFDGATGRFTREEVEGARAVAGILGVFATVPVFWALFDQTHSTWVLQGEKMTPVTLLAFGLDPAGWGWVVPFIKLLCTEIAPGRFALVLNSERMQTLNPLLVMLLIPVFTAWLYPASDKLGFKPTALRRMSVGMLLGAASFVVCGWLQVRMDRGESLSIAWQMMPYLILTAGEVMVSATGLEFAFSQAPPSMKSTIMSLWLLTFAVGNYLVVVVTKVNTTFVKASGAAAFFFYAALLFVVGGIFIWTARRYRERRFAGDCPADS